MLQLHLRFVGQILLVRVQYAQRFMRQQTLPGVVEIRQAGKLQGSQHLMFNTLQIRTSHLAHHLGIRLDQAAIGIPGQARIARHAKQPVEGRFV